MCGVVAGGLSGEIPRETGKGLVKAARPPAKTSSREGWTEAPETATHPQEVSTKLPGLLRGILGPQQPACLSVPDVLCPRQGGGLWEALPQHRLKGGFQSSCGSGWGAWSTIVPEIGGLSVFSSPSPPGLGSSNPVVSVGPPSAGDTPRCAHPHRPHVRSKHLSPRAVTRAGAGGLPGGAAQAFVSEVSEHLRASPVGVLHVYWPLRWGEGRPAASRWIT